MDRQKKGKETNPPVTSSKSGKDYAIPKWDISSLRTAFQRLPTIRPITANCIFPSPIGKSLDRLDGKLLSAAKQCSSDAVTKLYDEIVAFERSSEGSIRKEVLSENGPDFDGPPVQYHRRVGFVAYFDNESDGVSDVEVKRQKIWEDYTIQMPLENPLRIARATGQDPIVACLSTFLDIRLFSGTLPTGARSVGFFIVNLSHAPIFANGVAIQPGGISGPLPDFALIECGSKAIFWWLTPRSVNYFPSQKSQKAVRGAKPDDGAFVDLADETETRVGPRQPTFVE